MKLKPWDVLTREEQDRYLTVLWQDGYSEGAIADFLQTTKGRVVRRRQTGLNLKAAGRTPKAPPVDPERFADLVDLKEMEELEEEGVSALMPPSPHVPVTPKETSIRKETLSIAEHDDQVITRLGRPLRPAPLPPPAPRAVPSPPAVTLTCRWPMSDSTRLRPHLCGKPVEPSHDLCEEHLEVALGKK